MRDFTDIVNQGKKKKKEEEAKTSSSRKYYDATSAVEKAQYGKRINFDTFESDLADTNTKLSEVLGGWQTQETMNNMRSSVESMYKRTSDYHTYVSKYHPDAESSASELTSYYKNLLDNWDNIAGTYGQYNDADTYTRETTRLKELSEMTKDDVASYLNGDNPIAYTTVKGQDITWQDLYDEKFQTEMATSTRGKQGWEKYLADELKATQEKKEKEEDKKWWEKAVGYLGTSPDTTIPSATLSQVVSAKREDTSYMKPTDKWTREEKNIFGAYYLENPEKAYEYATKVNDAKNKAKEGEVLSGIGDSATSSGWAGTGHTLASIALAPTAMYDFLDDLTTMASGRPVMSDGVVTPFEYSQEVQGSIGTHLNETYGTLNENIPIIGGKGWGDVYGLGTSVAQSALSGYTLGGVGTMVSYFGQGASAGIDDALARGATDEQALLYGVLVGAGEGISESIGVDNMFKLGSADTVKGYIKNVLKQAGSEGVEENISSVISEFADRLVMQDKSIYENAVRTYMAQGKTPEEAKKLATKDTINTIAWDTVAGTLSGGIHGSFQTAVQSGSENRMNKKVGSAIRENETTGELRDFASELGGDSFQKYIDLIDSGKISDAQLGKFFNEVDSKTKSNYSSEVQNSRMRQVADMAIELGDTKNSGLIASAVLKEKDGLDLTMEERAILKTDTAQAILENLGDTKIKAKGSGSLNNAVTNLWKADSVITPRTTEEKAVASATNQAKQQALENQTRVNEKVETEGKEDISFYTESMEQAKAEAFNEVYDGSTNLEAYANSFELAYTYGKAKIGVTEALKNKGVLTEAQALKAYEAGNVGRAIEKQKIVDAINKQYSGKTFVKGTFDDSILREGDNMARISESKTRQNAINFLRAFSEVTGVNVKLISSTVDEKGIRRGEHGRYESGDNTVYIDIFAGSMDATVLNDTIIPTLSHEVTHWMKAKSPMLYQKMQDYALEFLAESTGGKMTLNQMIAKEKLRMQDANRRRNKPNQKVTDEDAIDELVARTCSDMLSNSEKVKELLANMTETEQKSFIEKVKETFKNILDWVNDLLKQYQSNSKEAELLRQYKERMQELSKMWDEALTEAIQTNQSMAQMKSEGFTNEKINEALSGNGISKDGTTIIGENVAQMDERTYREGGREFLENWLKEKVEAKEMDEYDAENIIYQTDLLYDLMQEIKAGNDLPDYAKWAETDATYNEDGQQVTVIVKNGDYTMNLDSSQVCKKRTALNAVLNAMVQSNDLSAYTLTEKDVALLNDIIKKHDFEIACALCFVDSKRYRVGDWANSFCEGTHTKKENKYGFNEMVRSLVPEGSDLQIDEYNFTGRKFKNPKKNLLKNAPDSKLDFTLIDKIMAENASNTAQYRYAKAIKENKELRSILNPSEIISSIGLDNLRVKNMKLYGLVNGHQGTAKPKFAHDAVAFGNDILKATSWTADKAKYVGGVRLQSFSDFMANMVFDYVQMISELSARELTSHAYTKEPLFVRLFGLTGMKINMSLVPRVALTDDQKARFAKLSDKKKKTDAEYLEAKRHAGLVLDKNGQWQYAWEDETFPYDVAMDIMADARYTKNCGTIAVGISDLHIEKLLADDRISMVIPYHKSGLNHTVALMRNIDLYNDYTDYQNTRGTNGKKLEGVPDFNFYNDLYGVGDKEGTHDPRQTAENYKNWCAENGYTPKFDQFKDNDNYYKLLIDFSVYDINNNMKYTEQEAVKPIYPAKEEFKELILKGVVKNGVTYGGLLQSQKTSDKLNAETNTIIKEFKKALANEYGEDVLKTQYDDRYSYESLTNKSDMHVTMVQDVGNIDRKTIVAKAIANARENGFTNENGNAVIHVDDIERDIIVPKHSITHGMDRRFATQAPVFVRIGEVLKNSIRINELNPRSENISDTYALVGVASDGTNFYTVSFVVNSYTGEVDKIDVLYSANTKKEPVAFLPTVTKKNFATPTDSTISIANLLDLVNEHFPDLLPEDVLRHYGYTERPSGKIGKDALYSDRDIDSWLEDLDIDDLLDLFWGESTETTSADTPKKQRATRRVDEVKKRLDEIGLSFTGTKSLAFTDERVEQYLREFGASTPNYAQAYIAYMTPQQYLNLTMGSNTNTVDRIENESASYGEIDFEKLGESGVMYLRINEGKNKAEVTGHEGRHRMYLLGKAGFERIPVLLFDHRTKYDKTVKDSLKLTPQVFDEDDFISKTRETVINDVIPFSSGNKDLIIQKFGSGTEADVYYADRDYTSVYELMGEKETLDEENRKLKADIEKLKNTIGSEDVKITRFRSLADYLKKQAGSNYSREELGDALKKVYNYIQTTDDLKWYNVMAKVEEIAYDLMQTEPNVPANYFREVMNDIRKDKVSLSAEQYAEAENLYGNYGNLHKALFGKVNLTKEGRPLEEQWRDWSQAYPSVFKADISATEMVKELRDIVDALKNTSAVMGEYERKEAIRHLGMEIYNQFWNIASDASEDVRKERASHRQMMEELRADYQKRQAEDKLHPVGEIALKYEKLLKDTIKRDRAEMKRIRELGNKRMEEYKERAEVKATIQKITKNALTLNEWFVKNNKDKHIPEDMKGAVVQLVTAIDFSSKQLLGIGGVEERRNQPTQNDMRLANALSRLYEVADEMKSNQTEDEVFMELDIPDSAVELLKNLSRKNLVLNQMNLEQLQALDVLVSTFKKAIVTANKNFVIAQNESRERISNRLIHDADSLSEKKADNTATNFLEYQNTTPYYMLKRLGTVGEQIFNALMDAQEELVFIEQEITDFVNKTVSGDKIKQWSEEIHEIKVLDAKRSTKDKPKYKTIKMTTAQIMSVYCSEKRESARLHLEGGGIRVTDIKDGLFKTIKDTEGSSLSKSELNTIIGKLTSEQRKVADALQKFMSERGAELGNKVTMARWDIKQFGEENYFPMATVAQDGNLDNVGKKDNSIYRLLNLSFTKALTPKANNQLIIDNIFDVFAEHMTDMAKYSTHALPLLDAMKILGYSRKDFLVGEDGKKSVRHETISVAKSIRRAFGDNGYRYIINLLKDLNGVEVTPRDEAITKTLMANYKISAVGGNLRVALLQGTAYIKAGLVLDGKYLRKALVTNGLEGSKKAMKHSGIALWKSKGHYDLNIARSVASEIKQDKNWMDKFREVSLKGAEWGDKITWGYLWNACEMWVKDNTTYAYNSKEFNKAVADKLREVIVRTQVVDSTLTRSQMMRDKSAMVQTLTAFMSESTMTYNMVADAFFEWSLDARKDGHSYKSTFSKHGRKFVKTISVYTLTAFATALAGGFMDAVRDDDEDEEFDEKYNEHFLEALGDNLNPIVNLPIIKDIVSIAQGYSPSRFDEQSFVNLFSGIRQWTKVIEGDGNVYKATYKTLQGMSQLTGLPVSNMMRDTVAMWNATIGEMYPSLKIEQ